MKFNFFGKGKESKESPDALLLKAEKAVQMGEYGMAIGHFRNALRLTRPEDAEEYQRKFTALWGSIESGAIRGMGNAGRNVDEFMVEGSFAINTLKNVKECNDLFNFGGMAMIVMPPEELARIVNDTTLKEIQNTLAPAVPVIPKKS
ncbi:hypothetical protein EPO56_01885 [Patescibacteria group bacterium]|nr:MAG: hypothetical protein EPO56_01885 [Patescibacteria group bacterium]